MPYRNIMNRTIFYGQQMERQRACRSLLTVLRCNMHVEVVLGLNLTGEFIGILNCGEGSCGILGFEEEGKFVSGHLQQLYYQPLQFNPMSAALQDIKLQTVDFEWIKSTTKLNHLKRAIALIEQDGNYFKQLKDACYARIQQLDPTAKRINVSKGITAELQENIDNFLEEWESDVTKKETNKGTIRTEDNLEDYEKYFDNQGNALTEKKKKERAEAQRTKGNQAIKSKDYDQAITYYSKSIDLDPGMHQSYGNRALAYLKKKQHQKCLADCEKALELEPKYTKAWHRKAKCLIGLKRRVEAYKCYKEIIKIEPENSEVNKQMMQLREQMNENEIKELESHLIPKSEFKKITIEEDSDEQIEEK